MAALGRLPETITTGGLEDRKRVVRAFLAGVNVDHAKELATLRWYRLPRLEGRAVMVVEAVGIEPTSGERVPQVSTCVAFVRVIAPALGRRPPCAGASPVSTIRARYGTNRAVRSTLASPLTLPWTGPW